MRIPLAAASGTRPCSPAVPDPRRQPLLRSGRGFPKPCGGRTVIASEAVPEEILAVMPTAGDRRSLPRVRTLRAQSSGAPYGAPQAGRQESVHRWLLPNV